MNVSCFKLSVLTSCLCLLTACSQHGILASAPSSTALQSSIPQLDQPQAAKLQLREVDINDAKALSHGTGEVYEVVLLVEK